MSGGMLKQANECYKTNAMALGSSICFFDVGVISLMS